MSELPKNKPELFAVMKRERDALEQVLNQLSDAQMLAPGKDGWNVKDHLAHLTAWEQGIAALLQKKSRHLAMGFTLDEWLNTSEEEKNARIVERSQTRALAEVHAAFAQSYQQMLDVLNRLRDEDLFKTYSHYQPDEPRKDSGSPILAWIAGDTYAHYAKHSGWIRRLIEEQGK